MLKRHWYCCQHFSTSRPCATLSSINLFAKWCSRTLCAGDSAFVSCLTRTLLHHETSLSPFAFPASRTFLSMTPYLLSAAPEQPAPAQAKGFPTPRALYNLNVLPSPPSLHNSTTHCARAHRRTADLSSFRLPKVIAQFAIPFG
jgi:hypothetical protein